MFDEEITYPEIREVLDDNSKSKQEKVEKLKMLLSDERQLQRSASESNMNSDDGKNARLRHLEIALDALGADTTSPEDTKAATL
jgi:hypothetical protein